MGITRIPRQIATAYSLKPIFVNSKAAARKGISQTAVVAITDTAADARRSLFVPFREKILFL